MSFNALRFRQTPFRGSDKLVFKSSGSLPLFDVCVDAGYYFLRSDFGSWRLYNEHKEAVSQTNPPITYTDIQIRQMLGHRKFSSNFENIIILSDSFAICNVPVTQELYTTVMGINPSNFQGKKDSDKRPVEQVSWNVRL